MSHRGVRSNCYGTLIDWESGILSVLTAMIERHGVEADPERLLRLYVQHEAELERGSYRLYRQILAEVTRLMAHELGFSPTGADLRALSDSIADWPPFEDTIDALHRLGSRYRLVILSNIDDDLLAQTRRRLGVPFDAVITAEQLGSYKPGHAHFEAAISRLGAPREQILHVAQSLYHDHVPAKQLGFSTVWVNRASRLTGVGLAPQVQAVPDLEVPDLKTLVRMMGPG